MNTSESKSAVDDHVDLVQPAPPTRTEVLEQLERLVHSTHFRNSKRYPALLRFVVEETLAGRMGSLKERTLGIGVFGRAVDYDTSADPVVRFTAGEIRKRIAQYYLSPGHEHELRFDLPLGSYVPHFSAPNPEFHSTHLHPESQQAAPQPHIAELEHALPHDEAQPGSSSTPANTSHPAIRPLWSTFNRIAALALATTLGALLGIAAFHHPSTKPAYAPMWNPLLLSKQPSLIVLGVHSFDTNGNDLSPTSYARLPPSQQSMLSSMIRSDMVPVSDVISYSELTTLLVRSGHPFRTQSAAETTFDQLRSRPVLLIGGFNNLWTMRLTAALRFHFVAESESVHAIVDREHPDVAWRFDNAQSALNNSRDYAIVGGFFDPQIEQHVLVVAGIGKSGTEAAAEFLTTDAYLQSWFASTRNSRHQNFEIVLSTEIIEGQHGPPHLIASSSW